MVLSKFLHCKVIPLKFVINQYFLEDETIYASHFSSISYILVLAFVEITVDGDCNHEIKRRLLLGRKVMTNLDSIFKSRDITLPTKVHLVIALTSHSFSSGHVWMSELDCEES